MSQGIIHEFDGLKEQIIRLKADIRSLSPLPSNKQALSSAPLPETIQALPDDPKLRKHMLAQSHREAQSAKRTADKYRQHSKQYQELYETATSYNLELKQQLNDLDGTNMDD